MPARFTSAPLPRTCPPSMGLEAMSPSPAPSRAAVKQLADEREAVERELAATVDALMAPGGGGLSGPLVDADGFPRVRWVDASLGTLRERGCECPRSGMGGGTLVCRRGSTSVGPAAEVWAVLHIVSMGSCGADPRLVRSCCPAFFVVL